MNTTIDLNSDSGEAFGSWSMGDDAAMMRIVSSANIACGYHAGDPVTMRSTCTAAAENGVAIGAHVSYPDLVGFGRRYLKMTQRELTDAVLYQMGALEMMARVSGSHISYVKPHGGLYNAIVHDSDQAQAVALAVKEFGGDLPILCLPKSEIEQAARAQGLPVVYEAFADRAYTAEGTLVPRTQAGSVIHDADAVVERVLRMVQQNEVVAITGETIELKAQSICVHGDTPGAVELATKISEALKTAGISIEPFTSRP